MRTEFYLGGWSLSDFGDGETGRRCNRAYFRNNSLLEGNPREGRLPSHPECVRRLQKQLEKARDPGWDPRKGPEELHLESAVPSTSIWVHRTRENNQEAARGLLHSFNSY